MTTKEMIYQLSNEDFLVLDNAIQMLQHARKCRAKHKACTAFKYGDKVTFNWPTNKGYRMMVGEFHQIAPDDSGKVEIISVKPQTPDPELYHITGVCVVDAAFVTPT